MGGKHSKHDYTFERESESDILPGPKDGQEKSSEDSKEKEQQKPNQYSEIPTPSLPYVNDLAPRPDGSGDDPAVQPDTDEGLSYIDEFGSSNEYRLVIIGKTGSGKSATANTLIGEKKVKSKLSASSVSSKCKKIEGPRFGKKLVIVDTPGLFDTRMSNEDITIEITKCIAISSPGPHAVLLVIEIGRITQEERDTVDHLLEYFGNPVLKYMIVVFTRMDDLNDEGTTLEEYIDSTPDSFKKILETCENRYIGFNNKAKREEDEKQMTNFMTKMEMMIKDNGGSCYSNEIFQEVEGEIQQKIKDKKKELEEEHQRRIKEIEDSFLKKQKNEIELMRKQMNVKREKKTLKAQSNDSDPKPVQNDYTSPVSSITNVNTEEHIEVMARDEEAQIEKKWNSIEKDKQTEVRRANSKLKDETKPEILRGKVRDDIVKDKSGVIVSIKRFRGKVFSKMKGKKNKGEYSFE